MAAPLPSEKADILRRAYGKTDIAAGRRIQCALIEVEALRLYARRWPGDLAHPVTGDRVEPCERLHVILDEGTQHRSIHNAGVEVLEPPVPPAHRLLEEADGRAGHGHVGIAMRPLANPGETRHLQPSEQAWDGVGI